MSVRIGASATPNRRGKAEVVATEAAEKPLAKDMAAYRRLRADGIQPRHVKGSAHWEKTAQDRFEIETEYNYGKNLKIAKEFHDALEPIDFSKDKE